MTQRGRPALGNPFPDSRVFSYGHRNSFGFAFDPVSGALWQTENGPSCNDEINRVVAGGNYAWGPSQTCFTPPPAAGRVHAHHGTTGAAFCSGCGLAGMEGRLLFGTFNTNEILSVTLTGDRSGIIAIAPLYQHSSSVLSLERGPSGSIYFSDFGAIYRLVP